VQDEYQIDDSQAGALQTAFVICYMLFAPLFGYLGDRHSRKFIMAFGVLIWVAATLVGSFMAVIKFLRILPLLPRQRSKKS
jgi:MFS family permease